MVRMLPTARTAFPGSKTRVGCSNVWGRLTAHHESQPHEHTPPSNRRSPSRAGACSCPAAGPGATASPRTCAARGRLPVVAPLINFAPTNDQATLDQALADLEAGAFDWLTVTSATTVDVLYAYRATIPASTKVAAVGETTAAALQAVGYRVDLVPERDNSAAGMAEQMIALEAEARDILTLRSEIAKPVLTRLLSEAGHRVRSVVAYRTVGVPVTDRIAEDVRTGRINAILVTSGSVAEQVQPAVPRHPRLDGHRRDRSRAPRRTPGAPACRSTWSPRPRPSTRSSTPSPASPLPHAADEFAP